MSLRAKSYLDTLSNLIQMCERYCFLFSGRTGLRPSSTISETIPDVFISYYFFWYRLSQAVVSNPTYDNDITKIYLILIFLALIVSFHSFIHLYIYIFFKFLLFFAICLLIKKTVINIYYNYMRINIYT